MWSLGCLLYSLFSLSNMFILDMGCRDTLLDLTICFGKLPDPWWGGLWKDREEYYDEDGQIKPEMVGEAVNTGALGVALVGFQGPRMSLKGCRTRDMCGSEGLCIGFSNLTQGKDGCERGYPLFAA